MGTAAIGSSCGAIVYPLLFERLQPQIGFPWTVRVLGFVSLALCLYATLVIRQRPVPKRRDLSKKFKPGSAKDLIELAGLLDLRYVVQSIAIFFSNLTFFVPLYYLQPYAQSHGMTDQNLGKYLLVILNAAAIPGRIIPSYIAGKVGVINTYIAICGFTTAVVFYWISVTNEAGNVAFSVLHGFFSGSVVTLAPVVLTAITDDLGMLGTRLGFVALLKGIGSLIGPPIAGAILDGTDDYLGLQLFTGLGFLLTTVLAGQLRIVVTRRKVQMHGSDPIGEPGRA
ncbi:hypothetical protein NW762_010941 [Fusarium torreyae]|uniref:Major facilitator superfamily (MFS) profile domain-containing protein n=1 Tax=Fusarium torreyae TaxID=1237075 RepID=A0A9W8RSL6_9HYPO|nr:hypothetical protein NW762_010941 [Fusarium torreyae]